MLLGAAGLVGVDGTRAGAGVAHAEDCTRTVTSGDPADLQAALDDATGAATCTAWQIIVSGTYTLTAQLSFASTLPLTIEGPATATARIERDPAAPVAGFRLLDVAMSSSVTLARLVLSGGDVTGAASGEDDGGAVRATALTLHQVELRDNLALIGGAVATGTLTASSTSFLRNSAEAGDLDDGTGYGGAVSATGAVTLTNVTFDGNRAQAGGAVDLIVEDADGGLDATFVTWRGNVALDATQGSDLHVYVEPTGAAVTIRLRGVLLDPAVDAGSGGGGGGGAGVGGSCVVELDVGATTPTWEVEGSFGTDATCPGATSIAAVTYGTPVMFLTAAHALSSLPLPEEGWAGQDAVVCGATSGATSGASTGATWPATDQRGLERPQGTAGRCDAGAVEREIAAVIVQDPPPLTPPPPPPPLLDDDDDGDVVGEHDPEVGGGNGDAGGGNGDAGGGNGGGEHTSTGSPQPPAGPAAPGAAPDDAPAGPVPTSVPAGEGPPPPVPAAPVLAGIAPESRSGREGRPRREGRPGRRRRG